MQGVEGFMYPNEVELQWSVLIVLYPFLTGLVAGAFILASLERVFNVEAVKPTYRLALLTALAFLLVAPLPLQLHLGHPERSFEMYLTPHTTSAMAMFGFVYLWYLMAVLVLEIWLDYRRDIVVLSQSTTGFTRLIYRVLTLGLEQYQRTCASYRRSRRMADHRDRNSVRFFAARVCRIHFRLDQGQSLVVAPLMPVVFLFSAMVSGIATVMLVYMFATWSRKQTIDMRCVDTIARYLFYTFIIDFSLEMLDLIHRIYEVGRIVPQSRLHGSHQTLRVSYRGPDFSWNAHSPYLACLDSGSQNVGDGARNESTRPRDA